VYRVDVPSFKKAAEGGQSVTMRLQDAGMI
jgi:hypothetical protein